VDRVSAIPWGEFAVKYTFLSKWTVLVLTVATAAATIFGIRWTFGADNIGAGILLLIAGLLVYAIAWFIALFDSIQERRFGWSILLVILVPFFIGPAAYGLIGPKNTK
jgi:hypothetical protein